MTSPSVRIQEPEATEESGSQAVKAQQRLREWILAGDLPGGSRIAELALVDRLGMSRTPIRAALMRLGQEGLLETLSGGGYAVRTFSEREVADAIELRGTLEGLAARLAAERGVRPAVLKQATECLDQIDLLLRQVRRQLRADAVHLAHHLVRHRPHPVTLAPLDGVHAGEVAEGGQHTHRAQRRVTEPETRSARACAFAIVRLVTRT